MTSAQLDIAARALPSQSQSLLKTMMSFADKASTLLLDCIRTTVPYATT